MSARVTGAQMLDHPTTLQRIVVHVPGPPVSVEEAATGLDLSPHQVRMFRRIGLDQLGWAPRADMFDLVSTPARTLLGAAPGVGSSIRYLVYAHSISDLTPADVLAADRLRDLLGLSDTDAFALTHLNCVSGLEGLDVAGELLRAGGDPDARALVVTGENPAAARTRHIVNTSLLGHAATACLVGLDGQGGRVLSYAVRTAGEFADGLLLGRELQARFGDTYSALVVGVIEEALRRADMSLDDVAMLVPHNVNVTSWRRLCDQLGLSPDRVFLDNVARYSHTYSCDPYLNLHTMHERGLIASGSRYLLVSVGLGATYGAMVIEY
jgi:3-oxoacyl-[acyl-carrier-protein] synthase-3